MNQPHQYSLFMGEDNPKPTGRILRDKGMRQAVDHANELHEEWQRRAEWFLKHYARNHEQFSAEEVREASKGIVPIPGSLRSWGSIFANAARWGWIRRIDTITVTNPKAHACYASLWESLIR